MELAKHFRDVLCFEPDPVNFQCACLNLIDDNVRLFNAALGEKDGMAAMDHLAPDNCGANRLKPGGDVLVRPLDDFVVYRRRPSCDVIWLDVEGYELFALKGATETIKDHHPLIVTEEKDLGIQYGVHEGEIAAFLTQFGYAEIDRHGNDRAYL